MSGRAQRLAELGAGMTTAVVGLSGLAGLEVSLAQERAWIVRTMVIDIPDALARHLLVGPHLVALAALPLLGITFRVVIGVQADRVIGRTVVLWSAAVFAFLAVAILSFLPPIHVLIPSILLALSACLGLLIAAIVSWRDRWTRRHAIASENR